MSYYLYLEDNEERTPAISANYMYPVEVRFLYRMEKWIIVRDYGQFIGQILQVGIPKCVSFDHDLGDGEKTGYDCAVWLLDYCNKNNYPLPQVLSHSWNPDGKKAILNLFKYIKP